MTAVGFDPTFLLTGTLNNLDHSAKLSEACTGMNFYLP